METSPPAPPSPAPPGRDAPRRPRVVILGGASPGSAPRGSSRRAGVDVVLVDGHDYHTFQPLLYQVATGLLETSPSATAARPVPRSAERHRPPGHRDGHRPRPARGTVRRDGAAPYDYLVLALGARVNFFGSRARPSTPFRSTRSPTPNASRSTSCKWEEADRDRAWWTTAR